MSFEAPKPPERGSARKSKTGINRARRPPPLPGNPSVIKPTEKVDPVVLDRFVGKVVVEGNAISCKETEFETISELGAGGFGTVKKVRHLKTGIEMAVKEMRDSMMAKERQTLAQEIQTVRMSTDCEFVINYYGVNCREGLVMIYMEVMEASLDMCYELLATRNMPFPESVLKYIAVSVLKGLLFLKEKLNVMHRDIKPSNVLLGSDSSIKLTDFGMAKVMDQSLLHSHVGCERYLAPERLNHKLNRKEYGTESDVWSYGVTLVELGMLGFPYIYKHGHAFQLFTKIVNDEAPKLPADRYSAEFCEFVAACLIKARGQRPGLISPPIDDKSAKSLSQLDFFVHNRDMSESDLDFVRSWLKTNVIDHLGKVREMKAKQ
eukprot:m.53411 g.53411  ORF g.53411 m.53411 type:complete len:377 (-) comp21757_c0_seq1:101-1231(-)